MQWVRGAFDSLGLEARVRSRRNGKAATEVERQVYDPESYRERRGLEPSSATAKQRAQTASLPDGEVYVTSAIVPNS